MTGVKVDDDPVGGAGYSHPLGVDELEFAESKEAVGAAGPGADGDRLALHGQAVDLVIHAAEHPGLAAFYQLAEAHLRRFGVMARRLLQQARQSPHGEAVAAVAEVIGYCYSIGIIHNERSVDNGRPLSRGGAVTSVRGPRCRGCGGCSSAPRRRGRRVSP